MNKGYFFTWRKVFDHWVAEKKPWCDGFMWIYFLSRANYEDNVVNFRDEYIPVKRGEFITSQLKLCEISGWGRKRTNKFLKALKNEKMATTEGTRRWTRVKILKFDEYQWINKNGFNGVDNKGDNKGDNRETTGGQQGAIENKEITLDTLNNSKKEESVPSPNRPQITKLFCQGIIDTWNNSRGIFPKIMERMLFDNQINRDKISTIMVYAKYDEGQFLEDIKQCALKAQRIGWIVEKGGFTFNKLIDNRSAWDRWHLHIESGDRKPQKRLLDVGETPPNPEEYQ